MTGRNQYKSINDSIFDTIEALTGHKLQQVRSNSRFGRYFVLRTATNSVVVIPAAVLSLLGCMIYTSTARDGANEVLGYQLLRAAGMSEAQIQALCVSSSVFINFCVNTFFTLLYMQGITTGPLFDLFINDLHELDKLRDSDGKSHTRLRIESILKKWFKLLLDLPLAAMSSTGYAGSAYIDTPRGILGPLVKQMGLDPNTQAYRVIITGITAAVYTALHLPGVDIFWGSMRASIWWVSRSRLVTPLVTEKVKRQYYLDDQIAQIRGHFSHAMGGAFDHLMKNVVNVNTSKEKLPLTQKPNDLGKLFDIFNSDDPNVKADVNTLLGMLLDHVDVEKETDRKGFIEAYQEWFRTGKKPKHMGAKTAGQLIMAIAFIAMVRAFALTPYFIGGMQVLADLFGLDPGQLSTWGVGEVFFFMFDLLVAATAGKVGIRLYDLFDPTQEESWTQGLWRKCQQAWRTVRDEGIWQATRQGAASAYHTLFSQNTVKAVGVAGALGAAYYSTSSVLALTDITMVQDGSSWEWSTGCRSHGVSNGTEEQCSPPELVADIYNTLPTKMGATAGTVSFNGFAGVELIGTLLSMSSVLFALSAVACRRSASSPQHNAQQIALMQQKLSMMKDFWLTMIEKMGDQRLLELATGEGLDNSGANEESSRWRHCITDNSQALFGQSQQALENLKGVYEGGPMPTPTPEVKLM